MTPFKQKNMFSQSMSFKQQADLMQPCMTEGRVSQVNKPRHSPHTNFSHSRFKGMKSVNSRNQPQPRTQMPTRMNKHRTFIFNN